MADPTFEAERFAEIMARVNDEMLRYGEVTPATTDALMKAKYGLNNFTAGTDKAAGALGALAGAAVAGFTALAEGKRGAAAVKAEMDQLAKAAELATVALTLLMPGGPLIKLVTGALGALAVTAIKANNEWKKMGADMSDSLYKSYSGLAKSGAAASSGMTGVLKISQQLSLNMGELDGMLQTVTEHSSSLALLGGSAAEGTKILGNMGEALKGNRKEFLALGMNMNDVTDGMARYVSMQTRAGRAQNMTQEQLASSARNFILEQDRLAQLTGMSAKKQQEVLDRAAQNEQFNAKIRMLELQGTAESKAAADRLREGLIHASAMGPDMEEAFMASVNGNLRNAAAQRCSCFF